MFIPSPLGIIEGLSFVLAVCLFIVSIVLFALSFRRKQYIRLLIIFSFLGVIMLLISISISRSFSNSYPKRHCIKDTNDVEICY